MLHILRPALTLVLVTAFTGLPARTSASNFAVVLQGFPRLHQQHNLTCEASAASMATLGQLLERQIMGSLPRDPNPNLGFRGNPDGQQGTRLVDYGVYAAPLRQVLLQYGYRSDVLMYAIDAQIQSYIDRGWPVVTWITYRLQKAEPRLAWAGGTQFFLVPHEHVVLVIGYDSSSLIANDPWTMKQVRYSWANFNRAWGYFANMALAIQPCRMPQPVSGLRADGPSTVGETWSWNAAANASTYHVQVIRHGNRDRVVYDGTQAGRSYTLPNPSSGVVYEMVVRSVSSCGGMSAPRHLFTWIPASPTPPPSTRSPTPSTTALATPAATSTATATPTVTPTARP